MHSPHFRCMEFDGNGCAFLECLVDCENLIRGFSVAYLVPYSMMWHPVPYYVVYNWSPNRDDVAFELVG